MRCPSCNKFATFDTGTEPEADLEIEGGQITGTVRIVLTAECCGGELKEYTFDVEHDAADLIKDAILEAAIKADAVPPDIARSAFLDAIDLTQDGVELEADWDGGEITDRFQDKDRHGRKIRNMRYATHYWGYSGSATVKVTYPYNGAEIKAEVVVELADDVESSAMDEMV